MLLQKLICLAVLSFTRVRAEATAFDSDDLEFADISTRDYQELFEDLVQLYRRHDTDQIRRWTENHLVDRALRSRDAESGSLLRRASGNCKACHKNHNNLSTSGHCPACVARGQEYRTLVDDKGSPRKDGPLDPEKGINLAKWVVAPQPASEQAVTSPFGGNCVILGCTRKAKSNSCACEIHTGFTPDKAEKMREHQRKYRKEYRKTHPQVGRRQCPVKGCQKQTRPHQQYCGLHMPTTST